MAFPIEKRFFRISGMYRTLFDAGWMFEIFEIGE